MPKKPKQKTNLTIVREGLDLSQSEFARQLGVSASLIKKVERGKRPMGQDLKARILAETGVIFVNEKLPDEQFSYTREDHAAWLKEVQFNQKSAEVAARLVLKLVELMLFAAARPGVQKSYQVWNGMIQALERVKNEFHLEKHIDAELRDRHSTETKLYTIRELRNNDRLAKMVDFKDDPNWKDDETIPLTKTTGWLPVKELFNLWWQHREFLSEIAKTQEAELTDEKKSKLEQLAQSLEKVMNQEADKFIGRAI
jgi:transcriptional regulator with XRE-family HTH domain